MRSFAVVVLAAALAACSAPVSGVGQSGIATSAPTPSPLPTSAAPAGTGITAESLSTALPVQAKDLRIVRVGTNEVALQFEFANKGDRPVTPDALGIDQIDRVLMLVDLPRSTAYEILDAKGNDGRISESNGEQVPPGGAVTVTAVFTAPPAEVTELTVFIDGMLPVAVPVQAGRVADAGRRPGAAGEQRRRAEGRAGALPRRRAGATPAGRRGR